MANHPVVQPTPTPTVTPGAASTATSDSTDIIGFITHNPLIILIGLLAVLIGGRILVKKGWEKLTFMYNAKGEPLPGLAFTIKRAYSVMFKEDIFPVFTRVEALATRFAWLNWKKYWQICLGLLLASLTVVTVFTNGFTLSFLGLVLMLWLLGVGHVRKVFSTRHRTLMQMFEVAMTEMRYQRGAELNPWGYIIISGWENLYYPNTTTVMFPPKYRSEDARNRDAFEKHFNSSVSDQHTWTYNWDPANNRVTCEPVPFINKTAEYKFPDRHPWNEFPLGLKSGGQEAVWDVTQFPHCLVAGTTGSGKSVTQRTMLLHALQSPEWRVVLVDPKRVELSAYRNHPNVLRVATELDDSLALIEQVEQEMQSRYLRMQEMGGVNHFKSLTSPPPAVLLMVDETFALLSPTGVKSDEGKEQDAMKARIGILIGSIARLGRAAGVHMILATQRPDAKVLPGEVKANLDARIAQGRMDNIPSLMTLDSDAATRLPPIKGRAILRTGNDFDEFQAYFLPEDKLSMVIDMAAAVAQGDTSFLPPEPDPNADMPAPKKKFSLPQRKEKTPKADKPGKAPKPAAEGSFRERLAAWVEKRKALVEANEARSGRTIEERKAREEGRKVSRTAPKPAKPSPVDDEPEVRKPTVAEIAAEARSRGVSADGNSMFTPPTPVAPPADAALPAAAPVDDYEDGMDFDDLDDYDEDDDLEYLDHEPQPVTPHSAAPVPVVEVPTPAESTPVPVARPVTEPVPAPVPVAVPVPAPVPIPVPVPQYEPPMAVPAPVQPVAPAPLVQPAPVTRTPAPTASISVQEVMRRAAERGVPIPASELLAALRAEAARQQREAAAPAPVAPEPEPFVEPEVEPVYVAPAPFIPQPVIGDDETFADRSVIPAPPTSSYPVVEQPAPAETVPTRPQARPQRPFGVPAPAEPVSPAEGVYGAPEAVQEAVEPASIAPIPVAEPALESPAETFTEPVAVEPVPEVVEQPGPVSYDEAPWMPRNIVQPSNRPSPFGKPPPPPEPRER